MATMCLPFDEVEQSVTFVMSGVSIAERMHAVRRLISKAVLTPAFHHTVCEQRALIALLDAGYVQKASGEDLLAVAEKIERLVQTGTNLIENAREAAFPLWKEYLNQMEAQIERFDSLAETFRLSASEQYADYVGDLVASASSETYVGDLAASAETEDEATNESWREFVARL